MPAVANSLLHGIRHSLLPWRSLKSTLCLQYQSEHIAAGAVYWVASLTTEFKLPEVAQQAA